MYAIRQPEEKSKVAGTHSKVRPATPQVNILHQVNVDDITSISMKLFAASSDLFLKP
jgi:hypothetical protein